MIKSGIEVDVSQPEGYSLKASVTDLHDSTLDVVYERGWRQPESVVYTRCRAVIADEEDGRVLKPGDEVDAYVQISEKMRGWLHMYIMQLIKVNISRMNIKVFSNN